MAYIFIRRSELDTNVDAWICIEAVATNAFVDIST